MDNNINENFVRRLLREDSLTHKFVPAYPVMENCPKKEEYDRQLKVVRDKEEEVELLYKQPFERTFQETYKDRIQKYLDYIIQQKALISNVLGRDKEYLENDHSCWSVSKHFPRHICVSCLRVDVDIPFEYLFREMSVEEWFTNNLLNEKLL